MEFKLWRFIWTGIVGMLLMIPIAYATFYIFDLISILTGGLIQNFAGLARVLGGPVIFFFISALLGVSLICLIPVHWALYTQPGNIMLMLALILPWIICCSIMALLTAKNPEEGIFTSLAIGLGFFIIFAAFYAIISLLLARFGGAAIIDGLSIGLTGLPFLLAVLLATMEGAGIGAVFAALIGSIKLE
ncbi:MAG: hypothetical protein EU532_12655 [Promethearchaeota archaeon]|nr:MAG: hypothetical protein EU532_12655 [Candidatus Lokiarchaeota archaeon]